MYRAAGGEAARGVGTHCAVGVGKSGGSEAVGSRGGRRTGCGGWGLGVGKGSSGGMTEVVMGMNIWELGRGSA